MYLDKLRLQNIRGFRELEFDFRRPDGSHAGWTVIVRDNGSGKSALREVGEHGLLPWCFCPRGGVEAPFAALREKLPEVFALCAAELQVPAAGRGSRTAVSMPGSSAGNRLSAPTGW